MSASQGIPLVGCRHDVLGHALKAIGVLRALARCADQNARDPAAEGWWNTQTGAFVVHSPRYPNAEALQQFFERHYSPTPIFGPWTKGWGYQSEVDRKEKKIAKTIPKQFRSAFQLPPECSQRVKLKQEKTSCKLEVVCPLNSRDKELLAAWPLEEKWKQFIDELSESSFSIEPDEDALESLHNECGSNLSELLRRELTESARVHETRKLIPEGNNPKITRERSSQLTKLFLEVRDSTTELCSEELDAIAVPLRYQGSQFDARLEDNPLFGDRGQLGRANIFRQFWACYYAFARSPARAALIRASLFGEPISGLPFLSAGTLFFPDTIKRYGHGTKWVADTPAYSPLDYVLAVEGLLSISGSVAKSISPTAPRYAAFPFIFESLDECTDNEGKPQGLSTDFFFPIWNRGMNYSELSTSFRLFEARLSDGPVSNSTEFMRVFRAVAPDVGVAAFRQFRVGQFGDKSQLCKSKSLVFVGSSQSRFTLQSLLSRLDGSGFISQFPYSRDKERPNLHPERQPILEAIETAASDLSPAALLEVLECLAELNARVAVSKALRDRIAKAQGRSSDPTIEFVPPLPAEEWNLALQEFSDDPEFEIARALASITGHEPRPKEKWYRVEPFLGSLVPLKRKGRDWILPKKPEPPSVQAVWSGNDLCFDLSAILARRHLDSSKDVRPALVGRRTASLKSILAFLRGELDERRIARLVMGLSLIDWQYSNTGHEERHDADGPPDVTEESEPIPLPYAALRSLIEVGCEQRKVIDEKGEQARSPSARSPQAIAWLCQRSPDLVASATVEALRRLAIVGVRNCYGEESRNQKQRLCGRDVVSLAQGRDRLCFDPGLALRLAAAVLIPLDWRDRWMIFRSVTLPQTAKR